MRYLILDVEAVAIDDVDTYLEPVSAPSNYKDPDKIAAYEREKRAELAAKAALDIDLARIVCIGMRFSDNEKQYVWSTKDELQERTYLGVLWEEHRHDTAYVTFNGMGYDLPLLLRRSLYLGVKAPQIQLDRYKHPQVIDLMQLLNLDGRLKSHGLQFYANRFGIGIPNEHTGADIAALVAAGEWEKVEAHCRADVDTTYALAKRMGVL